MGLNPLAYRNFQVASMASVFFGDNEFGDLKRGGGCLRGGMGLVG